MKRWRIVCLVLLLVPWLAQAQQQINANLVLKGTLNYCEPSGGTDTYACALTPAITAYVSGQCYQFKADVANTGAASLELNSLGALTIKKAVSGVTSDIVDNDIRAGQIVQVCYDGTNLQMVSLLGNIPATDPLTTSKVIGGTGAGSSLSLQSTSNGSASGDFIDVLTGNNGATRAFRVHSNGKIGIARGTTAPTATVHINSSGIDTGLFVEHAIATDTGYTSATRAINVFTSHTLTDIASVDHTWSNIASSYYYGNNGTAGVGKLGSANLVGVVRGSGDATNEPYITVQAMRVDIGTGYDPTNCTGTFVGCGQAAGPTGKLWLGDWGIHGPIGVQPDSMDGPAIVINNHYNGSPINGPSAGIWIITKKANGPILDSIHSAANTYPVDVGIGIVGLSNDGASKIGFTRAIQIGGLAGKWHISGVSKIGTGIDITQTETYGIYIHGTTTGPAIAVASDGGNVLIGSITPDASAPKLQVNATTQAVFRTGNDTSNTRARGHLYSTGNTSASVEFHLLRTGNQDWTIALDASNSNSLCFASADTSPNPCQATTVFRSSAAGAILIDGGTTLPTARGLSVQPQTTQTIAAGNTVTADACGSIKLIDAAGAVTTDTTNTFTAPAAGNAGCRMVVCNVSSGANTITLDRNANFKSESGADVALAQNECVMVMSTGASGFWKQVTAKMSSS